MTDDGIKLFVRWVDRNGSASGKARSLVTLAVLLSDDERLLSMRRELPIGWLDEPFVEELLTLAQPSEVVSILAHYLGNDLSPTVFKKCLDGVLSTSPDLDIISGIMFVAAHYLEHHASAFQLPRNLALRLLASDDADHWLAGIKAIRHCNASSTEIGSCILTALIRSDRREIWAGLSQLGQLLAVSGQRVATTIRQDTLSKLREALARLESDSADCDIRTAAGHCRRLLILAGT